MFYTYFPNQPVPDLYQPGHWNTETTCFLDCRKGWDLASCPPQEIHKLMPLKDPWKRSISRWWQLKYFSFSPRKLGKMNPIWRAYFSIGLKPPTRYVFGKYHQSPVYFYDSWRNKTCDSLLFKDDIIQFDAYQCCDFYLIHFLMKHIITYTYHQYIYIYL